MDEPQNATPVVNRSHRDGVAVAIRRFLDGDITAFAFDELLDAFRDSPDPTVRFVAWTVWYHYDDCEDHLAALPKSAWNYFQRLLLLLESDHSVETMRTRRWSWSQLLAAVSLAGFAWAAFQFGWGSQLLVVAIPFGLISIGISRLRNRTEDLGPYERILAPFDSFSELKSTYDKVPTFKKKRCPRHVEARRIRSPLSNFACQLQLYSAWLMLSPIPLTFQMLPQTEGHTRLMGNAGDDSETRRSK